MEDPRPKASLLRQGTQRRSVLRATQVDDGLSGRRAERFDHIRGQAKDDVVGDGEDRQVGEVNGGRGTLTGPGVEFLGQVANVVRVTATDRGNGVSGGVEGAPERRSGPAGSDDGDCRLLHDSVSVTEDPSGVSIL